MEHSSSLMSLTKNNSYSNSKNNEINQMSYDEVLKIRNQ